MINLLLLLLITHASFGQLRLSKLISDGMILQRDTPVNIWGWATVVEEVKLCINKQSVETITGPNGKWQIVLPAQKAGGPFDLDSLLIPNFMRFQNPLLT